MLLPGHLEDASAKPAALEAREVLPLRDPPLLVHEDVDPRGDRTAPLGEDVPHQHRLRLVDGARHAQGVNVLGVELEVRGRKGIGGAEAHLVAG